MCLPLATRLEPQNVYHSFTIAKLTGREPLLPHLIKYLPVMLAQETEEAVEQERAAAATRMREACERYEQQLTMQRMRLVSDGDMRLEQVEAQRCVVVMSVVAMNSGSEGRSHPPGRCITKTPFHACMVMLHPCALDVCRITEQWSFCCWVTLLTPH